MLTVLCACLSLCARHLLQPTLCSRSHGHTDRLPFLQAQLGLATRAALPSLWPELLVGPCLVAIAEPSSSGCSDSSCLFGPWGSGFHTVANPDICFPFALLTAL